MAMSPSSFLAARTIAAVRIVTGSIFLFFGEYKIVGSAFAYGESPDGARCRGWIHTTLQAADAEIRRKIDLIVLAF
jgi:hypothetical protein